MGTQIAWKIWDWDVKTEGIFILNIQEPYVIRLKANVQIIWVVKNCFSEKWNGDVVKLLLEHPRCEIIHINAKVNGGDNIFLWACGKWNVGMVKLLLDHPMSENIDFNTRNDFDTMFPLLNRMI